MSNPILQAELLAWRAGWRSLKHWRARTWLIMAALAVAGATLVVCWWILICAHAQWLLATAMLQPLAVLGLCAALTCYIAMHGRRRRHAHFAQSWLAALPLSPDRIRLALGVPVALRIALVWLALALTIFLAAAVTHAARSAVVSLHLCVFVGALLGAMLGWRLGRVTQHQSRHVLAWGRVGTAFTRIDGLGVLSRWPLLQARSSADPKFHARVFLPLLLAMPAGLSLPVVICILAVCVFSLLLVEIARGLLSVIPAAVCWLRSTPLPQTLVMRKLGQRTGLWFAVWLVVPSGLLVGLGMPLRYSIAFDLGVVFALVAGCAWRWPRLHSA